MNKNCPDCGVVLEPDEQFCGNCGCYLEWSDRPEPEVPVEQAPEPEAPAPPKGIAERVKSALGVGDASPPPPPPPPPPTSDRPLPATPPTLDLRGTAERPDAVAGAAPPPPPPVRTPHQQPTGAEALVVPVDQARQPSAQQPARPRPAAPPRKPTAPPEPLNPGDLVCGSCGAGNNPSRKFCRRCGKDLADATVAKVPWWRRLFRRRPKVKEAGSRPKVHADRRRLRAKPFAVLGLLAALGIGGFFLRDLAIGGVEAVRDRIEGVERSSPDGIAASSSQPGHEARLARDGTSNKYWAPAPSGPGEGEYLEATFDPPVRLVYLLVTPGVTAEDEELFLRQGRPSELRIVIDREGDSTAVEVVHLENKRGAVRIAIGESNVTKVRLEIREAYDGLADDARTAIAEVEFFTRK